MNEVQQAVHAICEGEGFFLLKQVFTPEEIQEARDLTVSYANNETQKVTHFHAAHENKVHLQKRVWNLLNKGRIYEEMVQHPRVLDICKKVLGKSCILGSFAANVLMPGAPGQEPHVDYPYWDMYETDEFPHNLNSGFTLNCQSVIMMDDFTAANGATACVPGSQKACRYPTQEEFDAEKIQMEGKAGDVLLFHALMWHCSMPNNSDSPRVGVLGQYLSKFVKPMEDQVRGVKHEVVERASPTLRQLIGIDLKYPEILDEGPSGSFEGRSKKAF